MTATAATARGATNRRPLIALAAAVVLTAAVALAVSISRDSGDERPGTDIETRAVFPHDGRTFANPAAAAFAFAVDVLGTQPIGDVVVEPGPDDVGVVRVPLTGGAGVRVDVARRDGHWLVLGAVGAGIAVQSPTAGLILSSPAQISGRAAARSVSVVLLADGVQKPMAEATAPVTSAGYSAALTFVTPAQYWGVLVVRSLDVEGTVVDATAVRVGF